MNVIYSVGQTFRVFKIMDLNRIGPYGYRFFPEYWYGPPVDDLMTEQTRGPEALT